jgi:hypothetical protein
MLTSNAIKKLIARIKSTNMGVLPCNKKFRAIEILFKSLLSGLLWSIPHDTFGRRAQKLRNCVQTGLAAG